MSIRLFILLLSLTSTPALALEVRCPEAIEATQTLNQAPEGWASMVDTMNGRQLLESMSLYDGNPKDGAALINDNEGSKQDPYWINTTQKGLWVACFYRQSTVRLVKELPKAVKKCTLKFKRDSVTHFKSIDRLVCQ